jgi:hypothetical protein
MESVCLPVIHAEFGATLVAMGKQHHKTLH